MRKNGAVGVDGVDWEKYSRQPHGNLASLLDRAKDGDSYRALAVRRGHIPKGNGETRPLGIPTLASASSLTRWTKPPCATFSTSGLEMEWYDG